jgi:hypothetical protein
VAPPPYGSVNIYWEGSAVFGPVRRAATLVVALTLFATSTPVAGLEGETFSITRIDFEASTIEITNHGDSEVDPNGLIVCSFPAYAPIDGAPALAAGESFTLDLATIDIPAVAGDGELGLYVDGDFENPDSIAAYVEWGTSDHARSPVGVEAGVWDGAAVDGGAAILVAAQDRPIAAADWNAESTASADAQGDDEAGALPVTGTPIEAIAAFGAILVGIGFGLLRAERQRALA